MLKNHTFRFERFETSFPRYNVQESFEIFRFLFKGCNAPIEVAMPIVAGTGGI